MAAKAGAENYRYQGLHLVYESFGPADPSDSPDPQANAALPAGAKEAPAGAGAIASQVRRLDSRDRTNVSRADQRRGPEAPGLVRPPLSCKGIWVYRYVGHSG